MVCHCCTYKTAALSFFPNKSFLVKEHLGEFYSGQDALQLESMSFLELAKGIQRRLPGPPRGPGVHGKEGGRRLFAVPPARPGEPKLQRGAGVREVLRPGPRVGFPSPQRTRTRASTQSVSNTV